MGNTISYDEVPIEISLGSKGKIRGMQYSTKSRRFAGIPYALPPTGEHRWRAPRPLPTDYTYTSKDGKAYDATNFKPICPQAVFSKVAKAEGSKTLYSEDCLLVNIWTPVSEPGEEDKKWPVVLWLHGGWFQIGDPSQEEGMNPTELISTAGLNAVFVAVGYRLNIFGFLATSALQEESDGQTAGNFGLRDQRLAMQWVQQNIHFFGGDPANVTLGGRSAGAYAVQAQVLHEFRREKPTPQLFKQFYMISNAIPAQPKTVSEAEPQFDEVCTHFNIPLDLSGPEKLRRLRDIPAMDLVDSIKELQHHTFRPVTDDLFIHSGMIPYLTTGAFAAEFKKRKQRLLIGEVLNEETLYADYNPPTSPNEAALRIQLENYYSSAAVDRILPHYELPQGNDMKDWKNIYGQIVSDGQVKAPSRFFANSLHQHGVGVEDIWRYQIASRLSFIPAPMEYGVCHAADKPFWNYSIMHGPTPEERRLMDEWIAILVAFVHRDEGYELGTKAIDEFKVATAEGKVEVRKDERWGELVRLGEELARD